VANITGLGTIITDLFGVIGIIINEVVTLITGDLLVLTVVGAFITMIVGVIYALFSFIKTSMTKSVAMRK